MPSNRPAGSNAGADINLGPVTEDTFLGGLGIRGDIDVRLGVVDSGIAMDAQGNLDPPRPTRCR